MRKIFGFAFALLLFNSLNAQDSYDVIMKRTEWFREARFGMFIHFGVYSLPARGEWVKSVERISNEDYQKYVDQFKPDKWNPRELAKLAKHAGMKYAVMTAKHHEGFAMFDTKLSDYKITNKLNGRDPLREFLDAFRAEGIRVGIYFSLIDWYHPDYPKFNDAHHPMRGNEKFKNDKINWDNYLKYMHGQCEELVKNYGKIDVLWFDFSYDEMRGEKWKSKELMAMVRKYQPEVITDNRLNVDGSVHDFEVGVSGFGDYVTPEQIIPDKPIVSKSGKPQPWEACLTLNNNWGYAREDNNWKTPELVIHTLVKCVSQNGNLLLNVGPDGQGNIPAETVRILTEVGNWMQLNSESIYGCGASEISKQDWGISTQKGKTIYLHWMYPIVGPINLKGYADKAKVVTLLGNNAELPTGKGWWGNNTPDNFMINFGLPIYGCFPMPYKYDNVIKVELK